LVNLEEAIERPPSVDVRERMAQRIQSPHDVANCVVLGSLVAFDRHDPTE
jgi:hypothetical protein